LPKNHIKSYASLRSLSSLTENIVLRQLGPRTLRTQDISAPSNWCRRARTVRHKCRSVWAVRQTLRHWYRTVRPPTNIFATIGHAEKSLILLVIIIKVDH